MTMYTAVEYGLNNVPAFLTKVWTLVEDPETDELISWDPSGLSFHVRDQGRFAKEILPHYFKHRNMASFVRQLNMCCNHDGQMECPTLYCDVWPYGFRKVVHIDSGAMKIQSDDVEFHHPSFIRGQENLLENIKRKTSQVTGTTNTMKTEAGLKFSHDDVTRVLKEVQQMKGKQEAFTTKMDKMKKENEALWREIASLRQKHVKQQQIVNKLIQFMIHLVGGNRNPLGGSAMPKRKMPLMISDSSQVSPAKRPRFAKQLSIEEMSEPDYNYIITSPGNHGEDSTGKVSYPKGPIIHEVTDSVPSPPVQSTSKTQSMPPVVKEAADIKTLSNTESELLLPADTDLPTDLNMDLNSSISSKDLTDLVKNIDKSLLGVQNSDGTNTNSAEDGTVGVLDKNQLSNQLDTLQFEIDSLKDMMTGEQFNFDPTTVFPLFNVDSTVPVSIENLLGELDTQSHQSTPSMPPASTGNIVGNELVQFQSPADTGIPDLSDLVSLDTPAAPTAEDEEEAEPIDPMSFINTLPVSTADDLL